MKKFILNILRFILIGSTPIFLFLIGYLIYDPFKVLYDYSNYSYPHVNLNRDYISTEMFINNYEKYNYNSFVFGSSRTLAFKPSSWKEYLRPNDSPYMFDASAESIYGIYTKLKYLDSIHAKIDNALIIICRDASFNNTANHKGHLFIKDPHTSRENRLFFQFSFFKAYLSPKFLLSFYTYTFTKRVQPFMNGFIEDRKIGYDSITNELSIIDQENEVMKDPTQYYLKRENLFYKRQNETIDTVDRIDSKYMFMLKEIKSILLKHKTKYKVIISPLYEQIKINPKDLEILKSIFSPDFYDFSGKNSFTESKFNYYETSHFRPIVGDSILKIIYK